MPTVACHKQMSIQVGPSCPARAMAYLNDWKARIAAAVNPSGGPPTPATENAVYDFLCDLCRDDMDYNMGSMCVFGPDDFVVAATPVILNNGLGFNAGFSTWKYYDSSGTLLTGAPGLEVGRDFAISTSGISTPGSLLNGYLDTGVNFSGSPLNAGIAIMAPSVLTAGYTCGSRGAAVTNESSLCHAFNVPPQYHIWTAYDASSLNNPGRLSVLRGADTAESFQVWSRSPANHFTAMRGHGGAFNVIYSAAGTSGTPSAISHFVFGLNNNGVFGNQITGTVSFVAFFQGFVSPGTLFDTSTLQTLYSKIRTFRNAIGGGSV